MLKSEVLVQEFDKKVKTKKVDDNEKIKIATIIVDVEMIMILSKKIHAFESWSQIILLLEFIKENSILVSLIKQFKNGSSVDNFKNDIYSELLVKNIDHSISLELKKDLRILLD